MNGIKTTISLLLGWLAFTACEGPAVGYLVTEDVSYPIDTIRVMSYSRLEQEIVNLEDKKTNYDQTEEGKVLAGLKAELAELEKKYDDLEVSLDSLLDLIYDAEDIEDWDEVDRLTAEREEIRTERKELGWELDDREDVIDGLEEIKAQTVGNIDNELVLIRRRINDTIPYTSSPVEGVLGTEPLIYSIERVSGDDAGKVALFSKYLTIIGGGRLVLHWSKTEQLPVGMFTVSIRVTNEGYSRAFDDVMTYIVE